MSSRKEYVIDRIAGLEASASRIHANILHQDLVCERLEQEAEWIFRKGDGSRMRDSTGYGPEMRAILRSSHAPTLSTGGGRTPVVSRSGGRKVTLIHKYRTFHKPNELKIYDQIITQKAMFEAELKKLKDDEFIAPEVLAERERVIQEELFPNG